jgi:hypothetical protein
MFVHFKDFTCTDSRSTAETKKALALNEFSGDEEPADSESKNQNETVYFSVSLNTVSSSGHIEVGQETICLFEIFEKTESDEAEAFITLPVSKFFVTLFRAIISPNAP